MNVNFYFKKLMKIKGVSPTRYQIGRLYASKAKKNEVEIPQNPLKEIYTSSLQKENGVIYDKKPFKFLCEEGKIYHWCLCGQSKRQPFCDGTHNNIFLKIKQKPIKFTVTKTKEYWLCNCKQTLNRPFCDGTHKRQDIQDKRPY